MNNKASSRNRALSGLIAGLVSFALLSAILLSGKARPRSASAQIAATPSAPPTGLNIMKTDFNGDGYADLAIGVTGEDVGSVGDAGAVTVLYGSSSGLTGSGSQYWTQDSTGVPDAAEAGDLFGWYY